MAHRPWNFLTSLRLTVALLVLCVILVFLGTVAQVHEGLWEAQTRWFKSFVVIRNAGDAWWVPPFFPGGYTLGFGLLFNLLAAHIMRFQLTWKKFGIQLTHAGVILLLAGQLFTDLFSRESFLRFTEGESMSYSEAHRQSELVVRIPASDAPGKDQVIRFPEADVARKDKLQHANLPLEILVKEYGENADVFSQERLREAVTALSTPLAALEATYSSQEAILAKAAEAASNPARAAIWKEALKTAGETDPDLVAAAKRTLSDSKKEAAFRADLKQRFRNQMLRAFQRQGRPEITREMGYIAEQLQAGKPMPAPAEPFPTAATQGAALRTLLVPRAPARGMDQQNVPYAIVEVFHKGSSLGTWLVSSWLNPQDLTVGERTYQIGMRNERYYQPFSLTLLKTTHEVYEGTATETNPQGIPKNFQSRVRIENTETQERREVDISMNNPLRYGGLTFYQSQMGRTEQVGGRGTSTLQVVRNPGWLTPYLGCVVVALGMTWQFLFHLVGFLAKARSPRRASA